MRLPIAEFSCDVVGAARAPARQGIDMDHSSNKYEWFALGDVNGFFGLMFDNLTVLSFLAGTLVFVFKFPADIVYSKMFPGTAFGVLVGDLVYTWMAFRLSKRTGSRLVTAMPLGLDTPSTIGMALVVLGPAFVALKAEGMSERDAATMTWYIGMATMVMIGTFKLVFSFIGQWAQRVVPQAGLLGSLAGIGLALIGLDAAGELADRRQLAWSKQRPVAAAPARPREGPIVPDGPDVHGDDEPVGVHWPASSTVPPHLAGGTADGAQHLGP